MPNDVTIKKDEEIDFHQLVGTLIDNRWLIAVVTGIFLAVSIAYAMLATPVYQADALLQVEHRTPVGGVASELQQLLGSSNTEAITEIALLTSRMVVGQAVDDLRLDIPVQVRRFPLVGDAISRQFRSSNSLLLARPIWGMGRYGWGGEAISVKKFEVPDSMLNVPLTLVADSGEAYRLEDGNGDEILHGKVGEIVEKSGFTIMVSHLRANPGTVFDIRRVPTLSAIVNLQNDLIAIEQGKDSGIIAISYQNEDPMLASAILRDISAAYVRQNVDRSAAEAAKSLDFVRQQLPRVKADMEKAQIALKHFQMSAKSVDLTLETRSMLEQMVAVETNIQQIRLEQAVADSKFQPGHPTLKALDDQVAQLSAKKDALQNQMLSLPDAQQKLLQLTGDVEVSTQTYTALLAQAQQLDVARAGTVGNARIVDVPAVDTTNPVKPKRILILAIGIVVGLLFSALAVFLRQSLKRGLEDPAAIEEIGMPVYASVPVSERWLAMVEKKRGVSLPTGAKLLAVENPADLSIEALRSLRTSLHFARIEAKNNILMITGSSPNAGKTFVASNLAAVIAQSGQRVLLVDADMRKGTAHLSLGVSAGNGLSELISGRVAFQDAIHKNAGQENLDFLSRGCVPPNPSELLMHPRFTKIMSDVAGQYDLVIVDTPPILAVTDAAIIGNIAGTSLMVVRFGVNQLKEVELARQRLEHNSVKVNGTIFNAVEHRVAGYMSYGHYAYLSDK
ncbi:tyrosine protein kinase [Paraburkholderia phytofirmans OLGA172]|uniref:Putative tyrosine-protein kinase EpsB n=1 Tax=Paraburkholderia phytofirmans OLGA172 TaxID=1417228 RepID=A0A167WJG6_9BURK|nr:polysaccharide biosynthesis tyrosine autokinase [Paraburkholderia phytofirmans]ANB77113.1 tyrosine protein kinase [Paraburkholderia phytofirmans OLGA172]